LLFHLANRHRRRSGPRLSSLAEATPGNVASNCPLTDVSLLCANLIEDTSADGYCGVYLSIGVVPKFRIGAVRACRRLFNDPVTTDRCLRRWDRAGSSATKTQVIATDLESDPSGSRLRSTTSHSHHGLRSHWSTHLRSRGAGVGTLRFLTAHSGRHKIQQDLIGRLTIASIAIRAGIERSGR